MRCIKKILQKCPLIHLLHLNTCKVLVVSTYSKIKQWRGEGSAPPVTFLMIKQANSTLFRYRIEVERRKKPTKQKKKEKKLQEVLQLQGLKSKEFTAIQIPGVTEIFTYMAKWVLSLTFPCTQIWKWRNMTYETPNKHQTYHRRKQLRRSHECG